jgi:hypothetical protein
MLRALLLDVFGSDSGFEAGGVSLPEVGPERLSSQVSCCLGCIGVAPLRVHASYGYVASGQEHGGSNPIEISFGREWSSLFC